LLTCGNLREAFKNTLILSDQSLWYRISATLANITACDNNTPSLEHPDGFQSSFRVPAKQQQIDFVCCLIDALLNIL
jgi:hypothetical protein